MAPEPLLVIKMKLTKLPKPSLVDLLGLILLGSLVFASTTFVIDPGIGWHLRSGKWMLENWQVLRSDIFLSPTPSNAWIHNQWLADIIFWKIYSFRGFPLLHILCIGVLIGIQVPLLSFLADKKSSQLVVFFVLFLSALNVCIQWFLRPFVFSFLFFTITYLVIDLSLIHI